MRFQWIGSINEVEENKYPYGIQAGKFIVVYLENFLKNNKYSADITPEKKKEIYAWLSLIRKFPNISIKKRSFKRY